MPAPLPTTLNFDVYYVGAGGPMATLTDYVGVNEVIGSGQLTFDGLTSDTILTSGGGVADDTTASVFINTAIGEKTTLEVCFRVNKLPSDFTSLIDRHIFIGVVDQQGVCGGLFFSKLGIAYTGSIEHDLTNKLVLNSALQLLPSSSGVVEEGIFYTLRFVLDEETRTVFVYLVKTSDLPTTGQQLRFILPAILTSSCVEEPPDGTYLSVKGTVVDPSELELATIGVGASLLIPNFPPVADAGTDQAARTCSIVQLNGTASFDPEGTPLLYQWRLVDGPLESSFVLPGYDGRTIGAGFVDLMHSSEAELLEITAGDTLLFEGVAHTISGTGVDGDGFYVQVSSTDLPGDLAGRGFRILRQSSISRSTTAKPTFYPDVPGLYRFDLTVFDGQLFSSAAQTVVNVVESPVPRGLTPDLSFIWGYLSDFWKLVENTEQIEVFWGAMAQVVATEMLTLWQHEYSKSLRDIQRTFQRRWLHYDLCIEEPFVELTEVETLYAGIQSIGLPDEGAAVGGKGFTVSSPLFNNALIRFPSSAATTSFPNIVAQLRVQLQTLDKRFTIDTLFNGISRYRLVVRAPFPFSFTESSALLPPTALFTLPQLNDLPRGTAGAAVGIDTYRVEKPLTGIGIVEGDYLVVDGSAYRIKRVVSSPDDDWQHQRLVVSGLPMSPGSTWVVCRPTVSSYLDFYESLCSAGDVAFYEVIDKETNEVAFVPVTVLSAGSEGKSALLTEHAAVAAFTAQPDKYEVFFQSVYRRNHMPLDSLVTEIPLLQEKIKDEAESAILRQNIDFYRTTFRGQNCLEFVAGSDGDPDVWDGQLPPKRMWAETTYLDNRPVIEQNFGIPAEFTLDDFSTLPPNTDYLSIVRGLWYTYFNGPTLYNMRVGTQVLLGLPFAEAAGTIQEIRTDFSTSQGRLLIQDRDEQAIVRSYTYPTSLELEVNPATGVPYQVGDSVELFAPLVEGVEIKDYIKDPRWFEGLINQGSFFEVEKFFKFMVRIDSGAFSLQTLLFAKQFIQRIKPTYTFPLFLVRRVVDEATVSVTEEVSFRGVLRLQEKVCEGFGIAVSAFDDPRAGGGGYTSAFDSAEPTGPAPVYPDATGPTPWGYDTEYLCPNDAIQAIARLTLPAPAYPTYDSIFSFDVPVFSTVSAVFSSGSMKWIPGSASPVYVGSVYTPGSNFSSYEFSFEAQFIGPTEADLEVQFIVEVNGVDVQTVPCTIPGGVTSYRTPLTLVGPSTINSGDSVRVKLSAQGTDPLPVPWVTLTIALGTATEVEFDVQLPAGTYVAYRQM